MKARFGCDVSREGACNSDPGEREQSSGMNDSHADRVSVVIPARDEEANIERAVRSIAVQSHLVEIVVVDDQSSDRTPEILERLRVEFPKLRVLRSGPLPEGWTGKAHAVAVGTRVARGEWLLLTDADTEHLPGSLETLLARAMDESLDLLSISPGQETRTWWEKAVIPLVFVELARRFRFEDVSNPHSPAAAANGQYILVRHDSYERAGGHEAVRGEILEDVELARRVKSRGGKLVFLPGAQWVRTRMYSSFGDMWRGWTKNLYLLYQRNFGLLIGKAAELVAMSLFPAAVFVAAAIAIAVGRGGEWVGLALAASFLLVLIRQGRYGRELANIGFDAGLARYQIAGAGLLALLLLNSARAHVWGGKVYWKGRGYSTEGPK